ncbi:MAG: gamma subclass chorismate mutase AroQ [Bacteroidales bacterium]|nr:gamma subclass chorismate mutase AroQ [Bacteroidales bacterium]
MNRDPRTPSRAVLMALLAGLALSGWALAPVERGTPPERRILTLMRDRLAVMPAVARWKWNHQAPITDPIRERALLAQLRQQAQEQGLDSDCVERFFSAQFDAAKQLQEEEFRRWRMTQQEPFRTVPDLRTEIRPAIDRINAALLEVLRERASLRPAQLPQLAERLLIGPGITPAIRATAVQPLLLLAQP